MSLHGKIDLTRPLSKEEADWLLTRAGGEGLVAVNQRQFKEFSKQEKAEARKQSEQDEAEEKKREKELRQAEDDDDDFDPEDVAKVAPLKIGQLREYAKKNGLESTGTLEELQVVMLEHLEAKRLEEESK